MATLLSNAKLGNTGVSGLLKSANTLSTELNTYKDAQMAQDYSLSAKTADDLTAYQTYLQGRISNLNSTGSTTNATKAISLTNTLTSAIKANGSSDIQRENIQVMAGNATLQDKYNAISTQYVRALNMGDMSLAQNLESQAYSVSQTIQYQAQTAAASAVTLGTAAAKATASGYEGLVTTLTNHLKQFNQDFATVGQGGQKSAINDFMKSVQPTLDALHVVLPKGAAPNYFDIVSGITQAIYQAHSYAAQAVLPYDSTTAQSYQDKANAIATGETKFSTLSGSQTYQDLQTSAGALASGQLAYNETTGGFGKAPIPVPQGSSASGFNYVPGKGVVTQLSPNAFQAPDPKLGAELTTLGMQYTPTNNSNPTNGQQAQVTDKSPDFIKKVAPVGSLINMFVQYNPTTKQNMYQFSSDATGGPGKAVYSVITDPTGKKGLAEEGPDGSRILGGEYGFNPNVPGVSPSGQGWFANAAHTLVSGIKGAASSMFGLFGAHASAQGLINNAQATQFQIAQANQKAAAAMLAYAPPPLPNISISQPPSSAAPKLNTAPLAVKTLNPQQPTVNPQTPSGVNLQGGSVNLQGGGGIRLQ